MYCIPARVKVRQLKLKGKPDVSAFIQCHDSICGPCFYEIDQRIVAIVNICQHVGSLVRRNKINECLSYRERSVRKMQSISLRGKKCIFSKRPITGLLPILKGLRLNLLRFVARRISQLLGYLPPTRLVE